jgi:cytochrome c553
VDPAAKYFFLSICLYFCASCTQKQTSEPEKKEDAIPVLTQMRADALVRECTVCHGVNEAQRGPILDGMEYWYLLDQLEKFHSGVRGQNPANKSEYLMGVGIRKVKNSVEMAYLADWFSKQEPKPSVHTVEGDVSRGQEFYEQRCASCHGVEAQGNRLAQAPSLKRLEGWYFLEQMRKFRGGHRGYHPSDLGGKVMAQASQNLTDTTLRDIVAYVVEEFGPEETSSERDQLQSKQPN